MNENGTAYERLRALLKGGGWDPELAMEDDGYGVGIWRPEEVKCPGITEAKRLIKEATRG